MLSNSQLLLLLLPFLFLFKQDYLIFKIGRFTLFEIQHLNYNNLLALLAIKMSEKSKIAIMLLCFLRDSHSIIIMCSPPKIVKTLIFISHWATIYSKLMWRSENIMNKEKEISQLIVRPKIYNFQQWHSFMMCSLFWLFIVIITIISFGSFLSSPCLRKINFIKQFFVIKQIN